MKVERCNGSHTMTMVMNPVSLTKDGPNMKAWEEMRAPEDEHNLIIRSQLSEHQDVILSDGRNFET